ncbi:Eukaryotic translation initiation factor 2 subunit 3 [Entomortierella chlamydospora]|uniref:Eukaryotic translation initiation factor 2 subunit 3 n=1 Tax=Entomortierella chlamydospora TaxID=101097 RepID=A0A9P6MTX9_9FUNG|nr:Eukaryotic translation initiation factor 2 subunit 3 [Entomortierella chlamydospora]
MGRKSSKRVLESPQTTEPKRQSQGSANASSSEEEYEVEAIVGLRDIQPGQKPQFYVKWIGYDDIHNTWEPIENLSNCKEMLRDYLLSMCKKNTVPLNNNDDRSSPFALSSLSLQDSKILTADPSPSKQLEVRLKAFQDIFKNSMGPKISIENTVDDAACPPGFKYTSECIYGKGVEKPDPQFSSRCECGPGECSIENGCLCMQEAAAINDFKSLPFEKDGRVSEQASRLLWECNASCSCGPTCVSRVSQQGRRFAMTIKRYPNKGWGVVLNQKEPIPPRTFVARYTGEIILNQEADIRGRGYDVEGATWLFDLDYNTELEAKYSIDAYRQGNESHFFNHSCDPNLSVYMLVGGDTAGDSDMMTLSFWSNRWIYEGDEFTFDYNGNYAQPWLEQYGAKDKKLDMKYKKGMTPCFATKDKNGTPLYTNRFYNSSRERRKRMEVNRDEALRCLDIAKRQLSSGDFAKARKFAEKSISLFPTPEAKTFLAKVDQEEASPSSSSSSSTSAAPNTKSSSQPSTPSGTSSARPNSVPPRQRSTNTPTTDHKPVERDYTPEQVAAVKKVRSSGGDFYKVLGVSKDASDSDIKKAYRKLALQMHPDKNGAPGADEAFKIVSKAFTVLSDPQKRAIFDQHGPEDGRSSGVNYDRASPMGQGFGGMNGMNGFGEEISPEELFNMFFGGGSFGSGSRFTSAHYVPYFVNERKFRNTFMKPGEDVLDPNRAVGGLTVQQILQQLETNVENAYLKHMGAECAEQKKRKEVARNKAMGFFGPDKKLMAAANALTTPSCDAIADKFGKMY